MIYWKDQERCPVAVKVWGKHACFTRPGAKVERRTYDVPPASAMIGILESIFWKPQMKWIVETVTVLKPIRKTRFTTNEILSRQTANRRFIDVSQSENRAQRSNLILQDVAYVIQARPAVVEGDKHPAAYADQFRRRVEKGRCFQTPYLGLREFTSRFSMPDDEVPCAAVNLMSERMLFGRNWETEPEAEAIFFDADVYDGVLHYPLDLYEQVYPVLARGGN